MATSYTDVDRLILERWEDVRGLQEAFEELQGRIQAVFEDVGKKLERWADERDCGVEVDAKQASFNLWKRSWENKRGEPAVTLKVGEVGPIGYLKVEADHPYLWVITSFLENFKKKEADRIAFAKDVRQILGEQARDWDDADCIEADEPFGKYLKEISEAKRVALVADPDQLFDFVKSGFEELLTLGDAIDQAMARMKG